MSRLTLRLPDSLHGHLTELAHQENVSLNHYIVYNLTKMVTVLDLEKQRLTFENLASRYPREEAEKALEAVLVSRVSAHRE